MAGTTDTRSFGGFTLGSMQLALPMAALREVMPRGALIDLPCPAPCIVGGLNLRGVAVPVMDLRIALGRDAPPVEFPCVVIMVHAGKLLGLLADNVSGIFSCAAKDVNGLGTTNDATCIFLGSIQREDVSALVSILSPEALSQWPGVPMVDDPEPDRQSTQEGREDVVISNNSMPVMLVRCGQIPLAMDALVVHATLSHPDILASPLALGHCRGVIDYAGARIAAIDLQSLCNLGQLDIDAGLQAFVLSLEHGHVAFLVNEVIDVVRTMPQDVMGVPAFALPHPTLFAGALPATALPPDLAERTGQTASQYLLINGPALKACPETSSLAEVNTPASGPGMGEASARPGNGQSDAGRQAMITFTLTGETATPLTQVTEILPLACDTAISGTNGALLGFMVNRGKSIPVLCLRRLSGGELIVSTPTASVLVVESDGEPVGFAVPQLKAIEQALWQPDAGEDTPCTGRFASRELARVGSGRAERLLPVVDLSKMARALREQR